MPAMNTAAFGRRLGLGMWVCCASMIVAGGCSSDQAPGVTGESVVDVKNAELQGNQRLIALENLWAGVAGDPAKLASTRETTKEILWKSSAPQKLRERAWALLMTDESPEGQADTRSFLRLRLPTETQWPLISAMCQSVIEKSGGPEREAWQSVTASLVRSYARKVPTPVDADRPERDAILALHPGRELEAVVFDVFVRPAQMGAPARPDDFLEKSRSAAWELLGRLDPSGAKRTTLAAQAENSSEPAVRDINRAARELGVVPITASELNWLGALMSDKDKRAAAWWSQASAAMARLSAEQRTGLQMRHLEPVRWASEHRPQWVSASRDQLLAELSSRLDGRRIWRKSQGLGLGEEISREALAENLDRITWGDALAILIVDEALQSQTLRSELWLQAGADRADSSCEHGGVLWAREFGGKPIEGEAFSVRGYQPRTTQRVNDRTFTAPEEMFADSPRSLAHYHFHVQSPNNGEYAGPGRGDIEYAESHGRTCLVFTSVRDGLMNVDIYTRGGERGPVTIDLGAIRAAR